MLVQLKGTIRRVITFALVAMMMFASLLSPTPTAAQSQSIQSNLTGVTITYGPPYELQEDGRYSDDVMETMMFLGTADVLAVGFMSPLIDLNGARDILLDALFGDIGSAATIDRGDYTGVSYSLDMLNIDGLEMGVFSLFMNQRSHGFSEFYVFLAPPAFFGNAMQTAQNSFSIDGAQLMNGVDPIAMGNMVTANIGITGGEAVTDVTDVTGSSGNTTETSTSNTGSDQDARATYLAAVTAEFDAVDQSLTTNAQAFRDVSDELITPAEGRVIIDQALTHLQGTNDRVAAIQVPAEMQDFHEEVLFWSDEVSKAGTTWFAALDGNATQDQAVDAINNAATVHADFRPKLDAEKEKLATDSTDTDTTGSTTTETTQTGSTGSSDVSAYIETVQGHRLEFLESWSSFNESVASIGDNPTDAVLQQARADTTATAESWLSYPSRVQQVTPPAGYEDVQDAYVFWADSVTELGNRWIAYMNGDQSQVEAFSAQISVVQEADTNLQAAITRANEQGSGSETTTADTSSTDTGSDTGSSSSSRTTRSTDSGSSDETDSSETATTENSSETSGRTTRSTDSDSSTDTTEDAGTSRTTRGGNSTTTDNTSETSGRSTSGSAANEWLMEISGATIAWNDDFSLSADAADPQYSNEETGEDHILLQTVTADGATVEVSVTTYENTSTNSMSLADALVDDPDFVVDLYDEGAEVLAYEIAPDESAVLIRAVDNIGSYYVYIQVTCVSANCDTLSLLIIATEGYPLIDTLDAMESGVAVEGLSISAAIPVVDVEEIVNQFGN